jgi:putative DNA primase/helicase
MPVISPEARHALLECAMALNEYIEPQPLKDADRPHDDPPEGSPGEDFNRRATQAEVRALLQRHGWSVDHSSQGTDFLRRPGKAEGYSATLGHVGPNILYVFSSNASPFQGPHGDHPGTAYKPFGVYGLLEFRGDFQDAARVLALSGYGATRNGHRPDVPEYIDDPPDTKDERDPWAGPGTDEAIHLTDVGNGLRLVQQFGVDLRYVTTWDKWLVWTKTRWQLNVGKRVEWHAKQVIGRLYQEAQAEIDQLMKEPDKSTPQYQERFAAVMQRLKWAHTSESGSHIDVMVKRARVNPRVQVLHDELDRQAYYLHVLNGTIDLRTGACRQPVRGDLITKCANVVYDPEAICPRWISFLQRVQGYPQSTDNLDEQTRNAWIQHADTMMTYLKRLVGMSLTGDVSAQLLPFLYGLGRNGKSTFLNTILQLTGEYGMQAPPNFLLARDREVHPTEQADLFSKRFISTIEVEKGKFLAESLMKMLTGGERIRARRMREDFWEFAPTWHIWLAANDKPRIRGRELATWRRIKLIPFAVQIPLDEVDPDLPLKLSEELPGILNWAIDGCLDWLAEHRLPEPEAVTKATEAYREESDLIQQFVQDCCKTHELARAQSGPLQKAFETYTGQTVNAVEFTELMRGAGYEKKVSGGRSYWLGLGLIVPQNNRGTDE